MALRKRVINLTGRGLRGEKGDVGDVNPQMPVLVSEAEQARDEAVAAAATAESAAGPNYPDTATGLAATTDGEAFAVDNGDGTVTVYLNDGGVAVEQRTLATTDFLSSPNGAESVGTEQGGTLQDAVRWVSPEGVDRTGGADATLAIQAAIDKATITGMPVVIGEGTFLVTDTIFITCQDFDASAATFTWPTNYTGVGICAAYSKSVTPSERVYRQNIKLPVMLNAKTGTGWSSVAGSIGFLGVGCMEANIAVKNNRDWAVGAKLYGLNMDCNYNTITVERIVNCQDGLVLHGHRTGTGGSCNQNTIIGGRYAFESSEGDRVPGTNLIRLIAEGTAVSCNSNVFINPSVEGRVDENAIKLEAITAGSVSFNTIISPRLETGGVAGKRIYATGTNCWGNTVLYGYGVNGSVIVEDDGARANSAFGAQGNVIRSFGARPVLSTQATNSLAAGFAMYPIGASAEDMDDPNLANMAVFPTRTDFKTGASHANPRLSIAHANGNLSWGSGASPADVTLSRAGPGRLGVAGKLAASEGLGVGNSEVASTLGTVTRRVEIFSETGASLGFIPVYDAIT